MRLILMRHAKSSWDDFSQPDHDRPLNARGRRNATTMGGWLRENAFRPDSVLCSTSARTRETLALLDIAAPVTFEEPLYHGSPETLLNAFRHATGHTVLLLAHNPGIGAFASRLVKVRPTHPRFADYPTCATLVAHCDITDWGALQPGTCQVEAFAIPREVGDGL